MNLFWHYFFLVWLVGTVSYAILRGGWGERTGAIIVSAATVMTNIAAGTSRPDWHGVRPEIIFVDIQALVALLLLALMSNRLWTAWAAAFQIPIMAIDFWPLFMDGVAPRVLSHSEIFWAYPTFISIIIGTRSYQRNLRQKTALS